MQNKSLMIGAVAVLVLILAIGGVYLVMRNNTNTSTTDTTSGDQTQMTGDDTNNTPETPATIPGTTSSKTDVAIAGMAFSQNSVTIKKGTTVVWTNNDSFAHTVTSDTAGLFNSGTIAAGQTFSFTFNDVGEFDYHCSIHSGMTGKVIVEE